MEIEVTIDTMVFCEWIKIKNPMVSENEIHWIFMVLASLGQH